MSAVFESSEPCGRSESKSGTVWGLGSALASICGLAADAAASAGSDNTSAGSTASDAAWVRCSAPSMPVLIRSHRSGGGSTASTITLSSLRRCSHRRTVSANPASRANSASTWSRSAADSVPRTYSAARASWSSSYIALLSKKVTPASVGSCAHTLANFEQTAAKPRPDRVHRNIELIRQMIATPAAVIGQQHDPLLFRVEPTEAAEQALELRRHFAPRQWRRGVGGGFGRCFGLFIDRDVSLPAHDIDGAIAGHCDHPGNRACRCRIELIRHFPHFEVGFFHYLFGQCRPSQDAHKYSVELCPSGLIKALECSLVAPGDGAQQPNELGLHQHDRPDPGIGPHSPTDRAGPASSRPRTSALTPCGKAAA